jgi:two-component system NtrC family sensor kinase
MKTLIKICLLLLPLFSQGQTVVVLDSALNNKWVTFDKDWSYQKGDNKDWANPAFDDSSWGKFNYYNLNMPDGKNAIANRGEIVWFRKHIKADSSLNDAIVLNIYQLGASEIYLDGKLIHRLGTVSADAQKIVFYNPEPKIFQLPLQKGKEQVLAIRYVNAQYKFPLYSNRNGYIRIAASTLNNANSSDAIKNFRIVPRQQFEDKYYVMAGIAILTFIIFLSFFLFFPSEKINGYFALSIALLILFCFGVIWSNSTNGERFWIKVSYDSCVLVSNLISVYCLYLIFKRPLDIPFKIVAFLLIFAVGCFFLYDPDLVGPLWALIGLIVIIRLTVKYRSENRVASVIFISSSVISLFYWAFNVLFLLGIIQLNVVEYTPIAFMLQPVCLAIYLGYDFGKRSQNLRLTLERVQKLSKEKETILTSQKELLEHQVKERTVALNRSLEDLKSTQSQLIQSEKMASLGELTAGIAHEIQNPLNFVNNFSEVSAELVKEMVEEVDNGNNEEVKAIAIDVVQNLEKINHHGKRASDIVMGMLEHSRKSTGEKEATDINALCDEYLRLSYHGLKAKDNNFNATMETHFDPNLPKIPVIPQDIGRVILNLINNAFYAVNERNKKGEAGYQPTVSITTQLRGNTQLLITIKDNGSGIPDAIREKIFQPFFTTKPTGQGTGLGLSLSYDIVKAHGGELTIESQVGEGLPGGEAGTAFIIQIPTL